MGLFTFLFHETPIFHDAFVLLHMELVLNPCLATDGNSKSTGWFAINRGGQVLLDTYGPARDLRFINERRDVLWNGMLVFLGDDIGSKQL